MTDTTPTPADRPADQLRAAVAAAIRADTFRVDDLTLADAVLAVLPAPALAVARQLLGTTVAEYTATPCSAGGCEPGGEPCTTHERLMAHAEGDHELCDHKADRAATGMRNLLEHVGINLTGRDITVAGEVVDRAPLRDRIRRAICEAEGFAWDTDMLEPDEYGEVADAVLAVLDGDDLPAPCKTCGGPWTKGHQCVDRAAVLREGARALISRQVETEERERAAHGDLDHETVLMGEAVRDAAKHLVRLAADAAAGVQPPTNEAEIRRLGDMVTQYGHGASALTDKLRRVRDAHRETCPLATGAITVGFSCGMCELLDAPAMPVEPTEPPTHLPKGTNAEDCPACKGTNPDYPFLCPGPPAAPAAPEEPQ